MGVDRFEFERAIRALPIRPPVRKLVALVLATYANRDGSNAHPGEDRLANDCGISARAVRGHVSVLRDDLGLLVRTHHGSQSGRKRLADAYSLNIPADVLERLTARYHRKHGSGDSGPITGTSASDHRNLSADHRKHGSKITGSTVPPTNTSTKDVDQASPIPTHPSASTTGRAREPWLCDECGSTKRTRDGDCVPCSARLAAEHAEEAS